MTTVLDTIRASIRDRGPIPFATYMSLALYHPGLGYYASGAERTGWRGHYLTSPELDPAFAELWARGFEQIWDACERPASFTITEVGPGEGAFSAALLAQLAPDLNDALSYRLVEPIPALRARQESLLRDHSNVSWVSFLDALSPVGAGCVFANEVLDNLPVHLVAHRDGRLVELWVDVAADGLTLVPRPPSPEVEAFLARAGVEVPEGHTFEVGLAAESFVREASRSFHSGALVLVDYGAPASDLVTRPAGTLLCYSATGVDDDVLIDPGAKDITAHVNWTTVMAQCRASGLDVAGPRPQNMVLGALGLPDLDARLRADHGAALDAGAGSAAVAALSRRQALGALADPAGLGSLDVLVAVAGIPVPRFMSQ